MWSGHATVISVSLCFWWCGVERFAFGHRMRIPRLKRRNCTGPLEGPGFWSGSGLSKSNSKSNFRWCGCALSQVNVSVLVECCTGIGAISEFSNFEWFSNSTQNRTWIRFSVCPITGLLWAQFTCLLFGYLCICIRIFASVSVLSPNATSISRDNHCSRLGGCPNRFLGVNILLGAHLADCQPGCVMAFFAQLNSAVGTKQMKFVFHF